MAVLFAALVVVIVVALIEVWYPIKYRYEAPLEIAIGLGAVAAQIHIESVAAYLAWSLAAAGAAEILRSSYRLIRAWADRTEAANMAPLLPRAKRQV